MKKIAAFCIGIAILTALAGCGEASVKMNNNEASSSATVSASDNSSRMTESSCSAVQASSQIPGTSVVDSLAPRTASSSIPSKSAQAYLIRTVSSKYGKNGVDLKAEYPQLVGSKNRYIGVNSQLEKEALSTIHLVQTDGAPAGTTSETVGHIKYGSSNFISAVFETSYMAKGNAHPSRVLRTVNYDLKADKAVMGNDMVINNTALCKAADAAVKKQLPKEIQSYFTPQVLKDSLSQAEFYFEKDGMAVSFTVNHAMGDHVEILIPYSETQNFRTDKSAWSNFVK